jgi:hypothetical protein
MTGTPHRFPLVQKALDEQTRIFSLFDDETRASAEGITARGLDLIDAHVHATDNYKEALMTVAVLMNCPPYIQLKSPRFEKDYNNHVQDMLTAHTSRNGITPQNEDLIQVYSALFIANGEKLLERLSKTDKPDVHWLEDIRENLQDYLLSRKILEPKITPSLLLLENRVLGDIFGTIDRIVFNKNMPPKNAPGAKPPEKNGPKR